MSESRKNFAIGIFVIVAITIFVYILLFLHPSTGDEGQTLRIRFANIDKVNVGTRVLFAGHPIGEVVSVQEVENARDPSLVRDDKVYIYELIVKIDSNIDVYETDRLSIQTSGLLGEKSIEITPRPGDRDKALVRVTDQVLYSEPVGTVEEAINEFNSLARETRDTINKVSKNIDILDQDQFFSNLGAIAKNIEEITNSFNKPDKWDRILDDIGGVTKNLNKATDELTASNGTIGKLINTDDLYLRTTSILSKGDTVMDDINHYGLLFQNDKGWQRLRARRINLMSRLETPQEFTNFFNDEVNQISTSLSRVNMIINETQSDLCMPTVCCPQFQRVFTELLQRVQGLEENLKLYDQQLVDRMDECCNPYEKR
jgi:phospholipid/cholesterol/gamma-HCH transport system substrate-binding protein